MRGLWEAVGRVGEREKATRRRKMQRPVLLLYYARITRLLHPSVGLDTEEE